MTTETANDLATQSPVVSDKANSTIAKKRGRGRPFQPGNKANPFGRPKKGETLVDLTKKVLDKRRPGTLTMREAAAVAWAETMTARDAAANRARADWNAYEVGLPKQTFVMEQAESPLINLLTRHNVVEGEYQLTEPQPGNQAGPQDTA